jgi:putative transposase
MPRSLNPLTPDRVYADALRWFQPHLKLRPTEAVTVPVLWTVLLAAAARITSISDTCRRLRHAPDDRAVVAALTESLPGYDPLRRRVHAALTDRLPKALRKRPQIVAFDLTLLPYYGDTSHDPDQFFRGKAKRGTNTFYAYASAYVVRKGQRFTVALMAVKRGRTMEEVTRELLRQVRKAALRVRFLVLDREFYSVAVIRYLQAARCPFLMPVVCHGRPADHPLGPSGSNRFKQWKASGWSEYTLSDARKRTATVRICVKCRNRRGERGKHGREPLIYAFWGIEPTDFEWVRQVYRRRFGVETSHRQMNQARIRTTTTDFVLRFLYVALGYLLRNLWVWLHYRVLSSPCRGGRKLNLHRLRLRTMLLWLQEVAIRQFGLVDRALSERWLPDELVA